MEHTPQISFNDILETPEGIYLAGETSGILINDQFKTLPHEGTVTTLVRSNKDGEIWFCGSKGVGRIIDGQFRWLYEVEGQYVWEIALIDGVLYYFTSSEVGTLDESGLHLLNKWSIPLSPRPFLLGESRNEIEFISSNDGIYRLTKSGPEKEIPAEAIGEHLVAWGIEKKTGKWLFGTSTAVFEYDEVKHDLRHLSVENYANNFILGISNGVELENVVGVVAYPNGVVYLDKTTGNLTARTFLNIERESGDVFRIRQSETGGVYLLSDTGIYTANLDESVLFYESGDLWKDNKLMRLFEAENGVSIFTPRSWVQISRQKATTRRLPYNINWITEDTSGDYNFISLYQCGRWTGSSWAEFTYKSTIESFVFEDGVQYASGTEGLIRRSADGSETIIDKSGKNLTLLGIIQGKIVAQGKDNQLIAIIENSNFNTWEDVQIGQQALDGRVVDWVELDDRIVISTTNTIYETNGINLSSRRPLPDWEITGICRTELGIRAVLYNEKLNETCLAIWEGNGPRIADLPRLKMVGRPFDLAVIGEKTYIVGSKGVIIVDNNEMTLAPFLPEGRLLVLVNGDVFKGTTLPHGTSEIILKESVPNEIFPVIFEYRINGGRWQKLFPEETAIRIGGSGSFILEYRGLYPNGVRNEIGKYKLKIPPPWYLNPVYLLGMLVVAFLLILVFFYWRHWHLENTNRRLNLEVKKQTKELEAATTARTSFLAGISHDIRNPLNGILLISESLSRKPPEASDDPRLGSLKDLGMIVDQMLGEVLDFATLDMSRVPILEAPVGVVDLIRTTINQQAWNIKRSLVQVNMQIADDLQHTFISTDRNWMIQVLSNLLVNALNYSESDRIEIGATTIRSEMNYAVLEFYVKDWGVGIEPAESEHVFERFYRGEKGIESGRHGTGLGLSICREVIEAMGGELRLESNTPSGSVFFIRARFKLEKEQFVPDAEGILSDLAGKKILIVEDLDYNRNAMVEFFELLHCKVSESHNGRDALEKMAENRYDLVLMDWDLPGYSGPEVTRRHRAAYPDDPVEVFALTAYTDLEKKKESILSGMDGFIGKPLTAHRLVYALASRNPGQRNTVKRSDQTVDLSELEQSIHEHLAGLISGFEKKNFEEVRINAHKLTTLALIQGKADKQRLCREIQEAAVINDEAALKTLIIGLSEWIA